MRGELRRRPMSEVIGGTRQFFMSSSNPPRKISSPVKSRNPGKKRHHQREKGVSSVEREQMPPLFVKRAGQLLFWSANRLQIKVAAIGGLRAIKEPVAILVTMGRPLKSTKSY